jgi:HEPN domain-containing protein
MEVQEGCPYDMACFHCQQTVEKLLKCLLTQAGIQAPRTHDLETLFSLLPEELRPESVSLVDLAALNGYAVAVRYFGDWTDPSQADALRAFELAERLCQEVRLFLPPDTASDASREAPAAGDQLE